MKKRCKNEVEQLHMFFQDWFIGAAGDTDDNFARVAAVLAPDFMLISPRGDVHDRHDILGIIRDAHGKRAGGFRIWISDFDVRVEQGPVCVATYREWQEADGEQTCRLSSVLFRQDDSTPNGVEWAHLHETWLPVD